MSLPADPALLQTALQHFEAKRFAEAEAACSEILARTPNDFWTLRLLGALHTAQGTLPQAKHFLERALATGSPDTDGTVGALIDLATTAMGQEQFAAALECCRMALARRPHDVTALHNCGNALMALNRHAEALEQYRIARTVDPNLPDLQVNEGVALMSLGEWPQGWALYQARLLMPQTFRQDAYAHSLPQWRGDMDVRGKTILLQGEQGLGDVLQFVRYAPLVAALGARVIVRVPHLLAKLLADLPGADQVVTYFEEPAGVDLCCHLMSLPVVFGTTVNSVPATVPYIRVQPEYRMIWNALLGPRKRPRIGIAWWGKQHLPLRSMPLATLAPLLMRSEFEFHALQIELSDADRAWLAANPVVADHSEQIKDFADTAALASLMDLVIAIDTSVAHLTGALGLPTWIMLPFSADSRWLIGRTDSPWYPTARLFRQQRLRDWDSVVADVMKALLG